MTADALVALWEKATLRAHDERRDVVVIYGEMVAEAERRRCAQVVRDVRERARAWQFPEVVAQALEAAADDVEGGL